MKPTEIPEEVEIILPSNDPLLQDQEKRKHRIEMLKSWANVIATVAALITALAAATKPPDPAPKASYEELKKAVEQNSQDNLRNHEDIAAMRAYIEGYMRGAAPQQTQPVLSASTLRQPASYGAIRAMTPPPTSPPPPPEVHRPAEPRKLPEYDSIK